MSWELMVVVGLLLFAAAGWVMFLSILADEFTKRRR